MIFTCPSIHLPVTLLIYSSHRLKSGTHPSPSSTVQYYQRAMADRGYIPRRNVSRSPNPSARSSGVFDQHSQQQNRRESDNFNDYYYDIPQHHQQQAPPRYNPSLRPVGSRVSLSEQFATTRREYEFGFDDTMSLFAPSVDDASHEHAKEHCGSDDDDETSTAGGDSFEGVVMVEAPSPTLSEQDEQQQNPSLTSKRSRRDKKRRLVISRSPYEFLCLDAETATEEDMRTAYFRLCDLFRPKALNEKSKAVAEAYFVEAQRAFERLILSNKVGKNLYDEDRLDEDDGMSATEDGPDDNLGREDRRRRREDAHFAKLLRRQQRQPWKEVGLQVGPDPLVLRSRGVINKPSVALSLSQASTGSLPAVSSFLEPKLRAVRHAIKTRTAPDPYTGNSNDDDDDLELYCPPTTLHVTTSILTVSNIKGSYQFSTARGVRPVTGQQQQQKLFLIPDSVSKDRPLRWGLQQTFNTLSCNVRLRQELFSLAHGKRERALARNKRFGLPDAVVELEVDALNPATVAVRASAALSPSPASRRGGVLFEEKDSHNDGNSVNSGSEPLHVEASISLAPSQGSSFAPRLGLAAHRRDSILGGILFACADSGSWMTAWSERAAVWSRRIRDVSTPWYSLPTMEIGYSFSDDATILGMQSGRPFTKQAKSGLRRLHDEVDLVGHLRHRQRTSFRSWTISGAVTTGGVAGYLRYAKHLSHLFPSHPNKRHSHRLARDLYLEAEICAQKTHGGGLISLEKILSGAWGQTETSHIAVRGLKSVGKSSRFGLEVSINNNASSCNNSVVLSLYFSNQIDDGNPGGLSRRMALPILLLQDTSSPRSSSTTNLIYAAAVLPMLGCAAIDLYRSWRKRSARKEGKEDEKDETEKKQKNAKRARLYRQRRAEADELVTLLAGPVTERQQQQRQHDGLVIISAKYGVLAASPTSRNNSSSQSPPPQWAAPEDVADVTVAIAALVDNEGKVCIPQGVRKSRLLGFWDPEPGRRKYLVVRYAWGGREAVKAVMGREELRLP